MTERRFRFPAWVIGPVPFWFAKRLWTFEDRLNALVASRRDRRIARRS